MVISKASSTNLHGAKRAKNDEFYTRLEDIEAEISQHKDYVAQFEGKTVLCNCDDPEWSNFFQFFKLHFKQLKLKKLITTHYNKDGAPSYKLEWDGEMLNDDMVNLVKTPLSGNGDFRSDECVDILKEADIVVTNPPFSIAREAFIPLLIEHNKKFVIIGDLNWITYKTVFPLLKEKKMFFGYTNVKEFKTPDGAIQKFGNKVWFTNFDLDKAHEPLILTKNFKGNESKYPQYDNYNAIDVSKVSDIPKDYENMMGVPITFLASYCSEQFDIFGITSGRDEFDKCAWPTKRYTNPKQHSFKDGKWVESNGSKVNTRSTLIIEDLGGRETYYTSDNSTNKLKICYARILIKRKPQKEDVDE